MPGLRRDAKAGKKLLERDEFIALCAEHIDGQKRCVHAGFIRIMQQDDVARLRFACDRVGHEVAVSHAPIHRIHGPEDHGYADSGFESRAAPRPFFESLRGRSRRQRRGARG